MKKITKLSLFIALVSTFTFVSVTTAASTIIVNGNNFFLKSDTVSANLDAAGSVGTVQALNHDIVFGSVTINMASTIAAINSADYLRVDDNRGQNAGWNVSVSATDFTATAVPDLSVTSAGKTINVAIPASTILTITPVAPAALFSTELSNVAAPVTVATPVASGAGTKIMVAQKGYGQGVYKQALNYTLTMPNYLPAATVITATDSTSKFLPANRPSGQIGLFAATYTSTISYSLTTGP
jgi:hypothetical protein